LSALRLAEVSGNAAQDASAFRALALQGVDIRKHRSSVDLAEEAVRRYCESSASGSRNGRGRPPSSESTKL
jgi:hypothetical protein